MCVLCSVDSFPYKTCFVLRFDAMDTATCGVYHLGIMDPVKKRVAGLLKDKESTTMGALAQSWSQEAASLESVNRAGTLT